MEPPATVATFHHRVFDLEMLLREKSGHSISVVIPARDEQATIAEVVEAVRSDLVEEAPLVDEILVVDDGSVDDTASLAEKAGALVVKATRPASGAGTFGKGNAMREGLTASRGDLVVFLDADVTNFGAHFVRGLLGPLLSVPSVQLVKGFYERPIGGESTGGGRVTELVARPLLSLLFPPLAGVRQPLAGESAVRRAVLEPLALEPGYGVEIGMLLDLYLAHGLGAVAQVDLGRRAHRNRPLAELAPQAREVLDAALRRAPSAA